ncbi:MAG: C4-type zinc ribbon domain-containing protein [Phycisphaerae bacterium]
MSATVTLPALLALFKLDRELHTLTTGLDNVQREQKRQAGKIADLTARLEAQDAASKKVQTDVSLCELDLKIRNEHIEKMRGSLNVTKTNKEYSAILVQISAEKAEIAKQETSVLELMQQVETANKAITELRTQIEAEQKVLEKIQSEQQEKVSALEVQISAVQARRDEAAKSVPVDTLRQYDRVSQKYPGDALAPVEFDEDDLETISCGACYMGLNAEHVNALRGRGEIRRCNSCNRILYLPEMLTAIGGH